MSWLIVGLGNPGPTYATTRHNVGYFVTDALAARIGAPFKAHSSKRADVVEGRLGGERVVLARSRSFMNDSGGAVATLASYYGIEPDHVIAIHDEIDIDLDQLRVKFGGGDNGHNGLKSMRGHLGTGDFYRVRVGIGRPEGRQPAADYVLAKLRPKQLDELRVDAAVAADAVEFLARNGLVEAQNRFNG